MKTRPKPAYDRQGQDWIVRPEYSFGVFSTSRFAPAALNLVELMVMIKRYKQTDAPNQKLVVKIKHYKQTNRQTQPPGGPKPNCGPQTSRHQHWAPTNLL